MIFAETQANGVIWIATYRQEFEFDNCLRISIEAVLISAKGSNGARLSLPLFLYQAYGTESLSGQGLAY